MDEALMSVPAGPPTAQPRANATRSFNAVAGKGMRMAHAKAIVSVNASCELFQAHVSGTEGCLRRHTESRLRQERLQTGERKQERLARAQEPGRLVAGPMQLDSNIE
jgi:hypothetical protein